MIVYSVELKNKKIDREYRLKLSITELKSLSKATFNAFVRLHFFHVTHKSKHANDQYKSLLCSLLMAGY